MVDEFIEGNQVEVGHVVIAGVESLGDGGVERSIGMLPAPVEEWTVLAVYQCAKTPLASVLVLLGLERDCNHAGDCLINDLVLQRQQSKRAEDAAFLWLENHGCGRWQVASHFDVVDEVLEIFS